jgi:formyl-CoA transferase
MGTGSHLVSGILAALIQRGRTGRGQKVEVAMLEAALPSMSGLIANELEGKPYTRMGNRHRAACPSNVYETADGEILIFCVTTIRRGLLLQTKLMGSSANGPERIDATN